MKRGWCPKCGGPAWRVKARTSAKFHEAARCTLDGCRICFLLLMIPRGEPNPGRAAAWGRYFDDQEGANGFDPGELYDGLHGDALAWRMSIERGNGIPTPEALRSFLAHVGHTRSSLPTIIVNVLGHRSLTLAEFSPPDPDDSAPWTFERRRAG